ncbi:group II intron reverse transcriptase/maturase [Granulosicoccus sp. 3-233]|uniref:group II intron reverse transcriptase/maturase n=1 Tax=Granulosicoccus sp. 3-233 TaxID=3417969 RepID=UPI003D33E2CA
MKSIKANDGAEGVDGETIEQFESNLKGNLYKLWNRMSSGSYFPQPTRTVAILKKDGGERRLGIPSVLDRIAQTVAKFSFEPLVEPHFLGDSYGYRPGRSAHQALEVTRKRCWRYDWVLEFDIRGLFDNIDHHLLMKAVKRHTDNPWLLLYIERWITAPVQQADGRLVARDKGVQQGGVISPVLSNLFMHYAFDAWMEREYSDLPWCRYADDGLAHCRSQAEAEQLRAALEKRLHECGLEMHPVKTKIVYCKDDSRRGSYPVTCFDFLGFTFRARRSKNKWGKHFINFSPAMSNSAGKAIRQEVRSWNMPKRSDKSIEDLSGMFRAKIQGWINYYGRFYRSQMCMTLRHINSKLVWWAWRKFKKLFRHRRRAEHWLGRVAKDFPSLFPHWQIGLLPTVG